MSEPTGARPRGRRPAGADTKGAIVAAARELFASQGYAAVSLRAVARGAGVDAALVHHYFEGKSALFAAAMESPVDPAARIREAVASGPVEDLGRRIVRTALESWDPPPARERLVLLLRAATERPEGPDAFREFLTTAVLAQIARRLEDAEVSGSRDAASPEGRAALAVTQVAGLLMARYVLGFPGIADAEVEVLVEQVGPVLQHYLTGSW